MRVNEFRKAALPQTAILGLCTSVYDISMRAGISELNATLMALKVKIDGFDGLIHPITSSILTPELTSLDMSRDTYLVGLNHGISFYERHYDPTKVAAAQEIRLVLNNDSYQEVYKEPYMQETSTVKNLVDELQQNHASALTTLGMTEYVQTLSTTNTMFASKLLDRTEERVRDYDYKDIMQARHEMEQAYDVFALQLSALSEVAALGGTAPAGGTGTPTGGTGTSTSYDTLIRYINDLIDQTMKSFSNNNSSDSNEANGSGEGAGENTNTDPNRGEDNTPSANA